MIKFQAKYLPALMLFAAKNDIRYYLNGIHVEAHPDGGAVLVATDGHTALVIRDISAVCTEQCIFKISGDAARHTTKKDAIVEINDKTERLTISDMTGELFVQPGKCLVQGKFPDWKHIMPKFDNLKREVDSYIRAPYLARAMQAHPKYKNRQIGAGAAVRLWSEGPNCVVAVEYEGAPEYCGLIMPVRPGSRTAPVEPWGAMFFAKDEVPA